MRTLPDHRQDSWKQDAMDASNPSKHTATIVKCSTFERSTSPQVQYEQVVPQCSMRMQHAEGAHLMDGMDAAGVEQDALCQGGLPRVDVGGDADVADVRELIPVIGRAFSRGSALKFLRKRRNASLLTMCTWDASTFIALVVGSRQTA